MTSRICKIRECQIIGKQKCGLLEHSSAKGPVYGSTYVLQSYTFIWQKDLHVLYVKQLQNHPKKIWEDFKIDWILLRKTAITWIVVYDQSKHIQWFPLLVLCLGEIKELVLSDG